MENNWYAVYTKPRWEKKLSETLTFFGIENYCPLNKIVRIWSDRKKVIEEPLFTSYLFVNIPANKIEKARQVNGILNFVYADGKPAIIKESEIDTIKQFLKNYRNIKLEALSLQVNDIIIVENGPFADQEGMVIGVTNKTVKVLLPTLKYVLVADLANSVVNLVKK